MKRFATLRHQLHNLILPLVIGLLAGIPTLSVQSGQAATSLRPPHAASGGNAPASPLLAGSPPVAQGSSAMGSDGNRLLDCTAPIRIMPLGDSITKGSGPPIFSGYRQALYTNLRGVGYDVEFVGSQVNGGGTPLSFDLDHEGHSGQTADWIADNVIEFLNANPADAVLLHIGTNDLLSGQSPTDTVTDVEDILQRINAWERNNDRDVVILLARIINRPGQDAAISTYNTQLAAMANRRIQNGDRIILVDMENDAGLNYQIDSLDWADDIHPSYAGYQKMADRWFAAIRSALDWPLCLPLRIALSSATILTPRGADIQFSVAITNSSAVTMTNALTTESPVSDCNRALGILTAGERVAYTCTAQHVTAELLNFLTVEATEPDLGSLRNTAATYVTVTDTYRQYLPFSPRAD